MTPTAPRLLADLGGTHARFAFQAGPDAPLQGVQVLRAADWPSLADAAAHAVASRPAGWPIPTRAAFAAATPLDGGDLVQFTNGAWRLSRRALDAALGLEGSVWLNDFEALAMALPALGPSEVGVLHTGAVPAGRWPLAVVGPGTGLGVGALVPVGPDGWQALPGEGGHVTLAAQDDFEAAVIAAARRRQGGHVSAERLVSGIGLPLLADCVAEVRGDAQAERAVLVDGPAIVRIGLRQWQAAGSRRSAGDGADRPLAQATLGTFLALLGGVAGNAALTLGARGGMFLGGGLLPRLGPMVAASALVARFNAKGRYAGWLQAVPLAVIADPLAALRGAARALQETP